MAATKKQTGSSRARKAASTKVIEVAASESGSKTIPVKLVGKSYRVKRPKAALTMRMALIQDLDGDDVSGEDMKTMVQILNQWIDQAFGTKAQEIQDRMQDGDDDLDMHHIMELMGKMAEAGSANPPT